LLQREAASGPTLPAVTELLRRLENGSLSRSEIRSISNEALKAEANPLKPWLYEWGEFVEEAHDKGLLEEALWKKYLEQAVDIAIPSTALTVSSPVSRDQRALNVVLTYLPTRRRSVGGKPLFLETMVHATGGDLLAAKQYTSEIEHPLQVGGGADTQPYRVALDPAKVKRADEGPYEVHIEVEALLSDVPDYSLNAERHPNRFQPILVKRLEFTGKWNLAPITAPSP
jgi:hypothetical protein